MRIYLANVGANSSDSFASPLFDDGTFEFLPISDRESPNAVRYSNLRSYYNPDRDLLRYVPHGLWDAACHNDPEFQTFTYGDNGENGRSSNLTRIEGGDVLLFLVRLSRRAGARGRPTKLTSFDGFYLVGGFSIEHRAGFETPDSPRFTKNAHALRGDRRFLGVAGTDRSRRFYRAVPITREICDQVFRDTYGQPWEWPAHRSELGVIGSYTRACRCMLDTSDPKQAKRTEKLRAWIAQYTGDGVAELLEEVTE